MSVITVSKKYEDVLGILQRKGTLPIVIVGCDKCAKTSKPAHRRLRVSLRR